MPTITLLKDKKKPSKKQRGYHPTERSERATKAYNTTQWRNLRKAYLMEHPLCEVCMERGNVTYSRDVHHIHEISNAENDLEAKDIAFDSDNLMALCMACHSRYHSISKHGYLIDDDKEFIAAYHRVVKKHNNHVVHGTSV